MARKRVIAYFLHESDRDEILGRLTSVEMTDSFAIGDIEEEDIAELQNQGIVVQPQAPLAEQSPRSAALSFGSREGSDDSSERFPDALPAEVDYYLVRLNGPLIESWRQQLEAAEATLLAAKGDDAYKARIKIEQVPAIKRLPFVLSVDWIRPEASIPESETSSIDRQARRQASNPAFDVRLHDPADCQRVEAWLRGRNVAIVGSSGRKIRFYAPEDASLLDELALLTEVDTIAEYVRPQFYNDHARFLLGIDGSTGSSAVTNLNQDGANQIVAVADTGIDDQHPDFQGRIVGKIARGRPNDTSDPAGHGTHVAGSILGDGAASGGLIKGIAPKAKLFFQSLLDSDGNLGGLPIDLNDLFEEARQGGARIHNNSWGANVNGKYTVDCEEVDEYINNHKDMLIVIAAGNAGSSGANPKKADPGFVDWMSVGYPATCKNAMTVGASRSNRSDGAMSLMTWKNVWPDDFPAPPIADEKISGDPQGLAAFSGRGPCDDHRIKPDLVAPGTDIVSTKSSLAPISNFWGPYPTASPAKNPFYAFDGGTSMAAPLVAGCAALVRQYYTDSCQHLEPSAALLKATLVNGTEWLTGPDSTAKASGKPNFHQGHGRVCMTRTIPNLLRSGLQLRFVDDWKTFQFARTGQRKRYQFNLPEGAPDLRICMAYTDAPARSLQNNLNLIVQHVPSKKTFLGNAELPDALTLPDPDNNLETIRIDNPPAGTYFIQIVAANLLKPPQDFALVVTAVGLPELAEV